MAWVIKTMTADERIDEAEMETITKLAAKVRMPLPEVQGMIEAALEGDLDAPEPVDLKQNRKWLRLMADVALSDGEVLPAGFATPRETAGPLSTA